MTHVTHSKTDPFDPLSRKPSIHRTLWRKARVSVSQSTNALSRFIVSCFLAITKNLLIMTPLLFSANLSRNCVDGKSNAVYRMYRSVYLEEAVQ